MNILILLNTEDCLEVFLILLIKVWYHDTYRIVYDVSRYVSYREVVNRCIPNNNMYVKWIVMQNEGEVCNKEGF